MWKCNLWRKYKNSLHREPKTTWVPSQEVFRWLISAPGQEQHLLLPSPLQPSLSWHLLFFLPACGMNVHHKCQTKVANLCGVNQKLMAEALAMIESTQQVNALSIFRCSSHYPRPHLDLGFCESHSRSHGVVHKLSMWLLALKFAVFCAPGSLPAWQWTDLQGWTSGNRLPCSCEGCDTTSGLASIYNRKKR